LRFRERGSDGGHNGIASVIYHLNTEELQRLRIGIGGASLPSEDRKNQTADYVLAPFEKDEKPVIAEATERAARAVQEWVEHGIVLAMNKFNSTKGIVE
ncbi:MAG: aminoacyl-tRNA hydrolase, partial [Bacteroidota bacterium]|nr:aminoacyl-tRNA hydrolase [Bacteroidota bacterium]